MAFAVVTTMLQTVQLTVPCKIITNQHHQKSMGLTLISQPTFSTYAIKNGPKIPFTTRINTTVCSEILTLNSRVIQSLLSPVEHQLQTPIRDAKPTLDHTFTLNSAPGLPPTYAKPRSHANQYSHDILWYFDFTGHPDNSTLSAHLLPDGERWAIHRKSESRDQAQKFE